MKNFLHSDAGKYPALEVVWIGGRDPELTFLDKYGRKVSNHDISMFDEAGIADLLQRHGITMATPKTAFIHLPYDDIAPTESCIGWRHTGGCNPNGERETTQDRSCTESIEAGNSGFCECKKGRRFEVTCDHEAFVCEERCKELLAAAENPAKASEENSDL